VYFSIYGDISEKLFINIVSSIDCFIYKIKSFNLEEILNKENLNTNHIGEYIHLINEIKKFDCNMELVKILYINYLVEKNKKKG